MILIGVHQFEIVTPATDFYNYYYVHLGQFFLAGIVAYTYRDVIRLSTLLAPIC